jgi:DNA-binding Xre family transcriptional regulator
MELGQSWKEGFMPKITSKVRKLRMDYQAKIERPVEQKEVAEAVGIHENTISRIEQGKLSRIDFDTLIKLCVFYSRVLDREIGVGDILEFDPNNKRGFELVAA